MAQYVKSNLGYGENDIYLCSAFVMAREFNSLLLAYICNTMRTFKSIN